MALQLTVLEILTAFLGFTEEEINKGKSPLKDYIVYQGREYFSNSNVTMLRYYTGDFFDVTIDHDSDFRCITQKTFSNNLSKMRKSILPDSIDIETSFFRRGLWPQIYIPRFETQVRFSLQTGHNGQFIQTDIWLD